LVAILGRSFRPSRARRDLSVDQESQNSTHLRQHAQPSRERVPGAMASTRMRLRSRSITARLTWRNAAKSRRRWRKAGCARLSLPRPSIHGLDSLSPGTPGAFLSFGAPSSWRERPWRKARRERTKDQTQSGLRRGRFAISGRRKARPRKRRALPLPPLDPNRSSELSIANA
jgi:hypothetical protein